MTPRENMLEVLTWGKPEYMPMFFENQVCGLEMVELFEQPAQTGRDPFGLDWVADNLGAMPDVTKAPLLTDVADWRSVVKFPDVDAVDAVAIAAKETAAFDRSQKLVGFMHPCGIFERLAAFMGFEGALVSLVTDTESCMEFFDAMADYKIRVANKVIDAYHPDVYTYCDDLSNARSSFMSPETYRQVIKPYHKKIADAISARGVIFAMHSCGKCEGLIDDFVDFGLKYWSSAQVMNDIPAIQKRYRGKLIVQGGWNSSGRPGCIDVTEQELRDEVRRVRREYGENGGFILLPTVFSLDGNPMMGPNPKMDILMDEWMKCRNY